MEKHMSRSMLAEQNSASFKDHARQRRFALQELEVKTRFLRFLLKELAGCRTDAEREVILPTVWETKRQIQGLEMRRNVPPECRESRNEDVSKPSC
jgi:hypothetical protein